MTFDEIMLKAKPPDILFTPLQYAEYQVKNYNASEGYLNATDGHNCDRCKNRGYSGVVTDEGYFAVKPCKCLKTRETLKRAKRSGLGNILSDCTFDKYIATEEWQKEFKASAENFCKDDKSKWFFAGGQSGAGKSHLCTAICGYYIKHGCEVRYMIWAEDAKRLKSIANDTSYKDEISKYKNAEVLYIDDFLKVKNGEVPTPGDINLAFEIVNHRYINDKITIISSEKTLDEIVDYDEATMGRIYHATGIYKCNIGKDKRKNYRMRG